MLLKNNWITRVSHYETQEQLNVHAKKSNQRCFQVAKNHRRNHYIEINLISAI